MLLVVKLDGTREEKVGLAILRLVGFVKSLIESGGGEDRVILRLMI